MDTSGSWLDDFDVNLLSQYVTRVTPPRGGIGVGGGGRNLDTPSPPPVTCPRPAIGVGTGSSSSPAMTSGGPTIGVASISRPMVGYKSTPRRATTGGKRPRRVPRQNTPSSSSDSGSRRRSSRSSGRGAGGGGGGSSGGGSDDCSPPSSVRDAQFDQCAQLSTSSHDKTCEETTTTCDKDLSTSGRCRGTGQSLGRPVYQESCEGIGQSHGQTGREGSRHRCRGCWCEVRSLQSHEKDQETTTMNHITTRC